MKELIEAVKAEAEKAFQDAKDADRYPRDQMDENERARDAALQRIKACDEALEAIAGAARHLVGSTGGDLANGVRAARESATGHRNVPTPKRGFA